MKSNRLIPLFCIAALCAGCGGDGSNNGTVNDRAVNVLTITVNGSLCSDSRDYPNKACVSLTICSPGTDNCRTVNDILLDTGSYGLRIFSTALGGVSLAQVASGSGSLAECAGFGNGMTLWGPVQLADVVMGSEPTVRLPIQVINASFGSRPDACRNADANPGDAGFNGILGVGLFNQDCGPDCAKTDNNGMYFSCGATSCAPTTVSLDDQVQNPVARLPLDNNGVVVQLPAVAQGGAVSANGSLIFGIGTRDNNIPVSGVVTYPADKYGAFITAIDNVIYGDSFLDTGSNGIFFSSTTLPDCPSDYSGWYCPSSPVSLLASTSGYSGSPSTTVSFTIDNTISLLSGSNMVFSNLGGSLFGSFDWGLPFFLGRTVYVGLNGTSSTLGTGPYWAY
jgi:hypothetical protein